MNVLTIKDFSSTSSNSNNLLERQTRAKISTWDSILMMKLVYQLVIAVSSSVMGESFTLLTQNTS